MIRWRQYFSSPISRWFQRVVLVLTILAVVRLGWLVESWILGTNDIRRHHVESTAFVFAGLLLVRALGFLRSVPDVAESPVRGRVPAILVALVVCLAFYWPALTVGLLSDDFVLVSAAKSQDFLSESWTYVRPLPLLIWSGLAAVLPTQSLPVGLHVLNVGLHALNASAVFTLARRFGLATLAAGGAAAMFAMFPLNVEPVVWISGLFDVAFTAAALQLVLFALRAPRADAVHIIIVMVLTGSALACKETAVVVPVIVALSVFGLTGSTKLGDYWVAGVGAVVTSIYVAGRLMLDVGRDTFPELSGYAAKELASRPFGALAVPLHSAFVNSLPWVAVATTLIALVLLVASTLSGDRVRARARIAIAMAIWVLVSVLPVINGMYVAPSLEGSRYLYLGSVAWVLLLSSGIRSRRLVGVSVSLGIVVLVGVFAVASRAQLQTWTLASQMRDRVLERVADVPKECTAVRVENVPDSVEGAFVLRNGLREALLLSNAPVQLAPEDPSACVVDLQGVR